MAYILASIALAIVTFGRGLASKERAASFQYILGVLFAVLWVPQIVRHSGSQGQNSFATESFSLIVVLCTAATLIGFEIGRKRGTTNDKVASPSHFRFGMAHLPIAAGLMSAAGFTALAYLSTLPEEQRNERSPEGDIVMVAFLSKAIEISFAFCYVGIRRGGSKFLWLLLILDAIFIGYRIVFIAKRSVLAEIALVIISAEWFTRRKSLPILFCIALIAAPPIVLTFGALYRRGVESTNGQWGGRNVGGESIGSGLQNVQDNLDSRTNFTNMAASEAMNAIAGIEAKKQTGDYNFGTADINAIIKMLVPRQVFGSVRDYLLLPGVGNDSYKVFRYIPKKGTPTTGFATSFEAFGYFGCLMFFAFGWVVAIVFNRAERGDLLSQALYAHVVFATVNAFTHSTNRLPIAGIRVAILVVPAFLIAALFIQRTRRSRHIVQRGTPRFPTHSPPSPKSHDS